MTFKTKNKVLVAQTKTSTIEFGDKIKVGDFEVPGPGEFEIDNILVSSKEENIYSIYADGAHVVFWRALNGQPHIDEQLGDIDALVLELGEKTTIKDVTATINNLEPNDIVLSRPDKKDELIKAEGLPTKELESWKIEPEGGVTDRELILLPCSKE